MKKTLQHKALRVIILLVCSLGLSQNADAHKTTLDSYGCHNNTSLTVYECHTGQLAGKSWTNPGGKTKMLVELNTPPPPVVPPMVPVLAVTGHVLTWQQTTPPQTNGFRLFWSVDGVWHGPLELGTTLTAALPGLLRGATYRFYVIAYNNAGVSPQSNIATLEIP
ncbi:MAG: fibronectin type III domain-containing protein [Cetobacterium sp.]